MENGESKVLNTRKLINICKSGWRFGAPFLAISNLAIAKKAYHYAAQLDAQLSKSPPYYTQENVMFEHSPSAQTPEKCRTTSHDCVALKQYKYNMKRSCPEKINLHQSST